MVAPSKSPKNAPKPVVLMILDGLGERAETDANAVRLATTPNLEVLYAKYPHGVIGTSGPDVGLPPGQMGNSEVGHLNFGAGRIALMDIMRIDATVADGSIGRHARHRRAVMEKARAAGGRLHLFGLVSDGGVHSHAHAALRAHRRRSQARRARRRARVPRRARRAARHRARLPAQARGAGSPARASSARSAVATGAWTATIAGSASKRPIARSSRPRASATRAPSAGTEASIAAGKTDEFVEPFVVGDYAGIDAAKDAGAPLQLPPRSRARAHARARRRTSSTSSRARTIARRSRGRYACMTTYDSSFELPIAFPEGDVPRHLPRGDRARRAHAVPLRRDREVRARDVLLQRRSRGGLPGRRARDDPFAEGRRHVRPQAGDVRGGRRRCRREGRRVGQVRLHPRQLRQPRHGRSHRRARRGDHAPSRPSTSASVASPRRCARSTARSSSPPITATASR